MVTLKDLHEYTLLKKEVADLKKRLNQDDIVSDVVTGSYTEHPYTKHPVSITGIDCAYKKSRHDDYNKKISSLCKKISEIEDWLSAVDDSLIRLIVRFKYFDGLSWTWVARKIGGGHTSESIRQYFIRFMRQQEKANRMSQKTMI